ncbi:LCP family protein [Streptomyces sp. NPDC093085]|uniref:LCP family protein n=1 Tax=Streptomyces sp. NPDC093085 TaxID=3155068 RepID=UPI003443C385
MDEDVTESAGDPPEPEPPESEPAEQERGSTAPRRRRRWPRWVALGAAVVVLGASGAGWWAYRTLDRNITTDTSAAAELHAYEKERPAPISLDAQNILLIGSDSRAGGNGKYGRDDGGSQRSDTAILLHLAADRKSATAMSVPRDLMVEIPSCRAPDGSRSREQFAQFNWAFQFGGAACTIRTLENLTGIRIDHHIVVDFRGFERTVDAVDGVEVCLAEPVDDREARLTLPAGRQTLDGEQSLGYVRARYSIGDGSDTQRMDRQQRFLGALFKKVQSNGVLLNPTRLYSVLDAVTKSLTTDEGLNSLTDLYDVAASMRDIPAERVQFLTVPRQPYALDPNRDELVETSARKLFERLRDDEPVVITPASETPPEEGAGEKASEAGPEAAPSGSPEPTPEPTFTGSNAEAGMCG